MLQQIQEKILDKKSQSSTSLIAQFLILSLSIWVITVLYLYPKYKIVQFINQPLRILSA